MEGTLGHVHHKELHSFGLMTGEGVPERYDLGKDLRRRGRVSCGCLREQHPPQRKKQEPQGIKCLPFFKKNSLCADEKDQREGQMDDAGERENHWAIE